VSPVPEPSAASCERSAPEAVTEVPATTLAEAPAKTVTEAPATTAAARPGGGR